MKNNDFSLQNLWFDIMEKFGPRRIAIVVLLIVEVTFFSIVTEYFLTMPNFRNILSNSVDLAIVAIGMTMIILMGQIDVSIGSVLGIIAIVVSNLLLMGVNPILVIIAGIITGAILGSLNGVLVGYVGIPGIIVTLGMMNIWRAGIFGLLGGDWISGIPPVFDFISDQFYGIPINLIIILALYAIFWYVLKYRRFGRHIYAIGNDKEAARLSGIKVERVIVYTYALMGALVSLAAFTYLGRMGGVEITVKQLLPLKAIAAVVIGGTAITGGKGSVLGTLLGVLFVNVLQNGIILLGIPSLWEQAIVGVLIILAMASDLIRSGERESEKEEAYAG